MCPYLFVMRLIIITDPEFLPGEAEIIKRMLDEGVWRIHVRKPGADTESTARLIEALPAEYRGRISLHDHHGTAADLEIGGIHLNSRNPLPPGDFQGMVSCSCHSLEEVASHHDAVDYMFLSPIFDSISKQGYKSHFSLEELRNFISTAAAVKEGCWLFALGGVTPGCLPLLKEAGFSGAAVLGYIWEPYKRDFNIDALIKRLTELKMGI